jgi:hypothetical protein
MWRSPKPMPDVVRRTATRRREFMDKETALHDIDQLEDAICFEQDLIEKAIYKTQQKIRSYRDRIEELRKIATS